MEFSKHVSYSDSNPFADDHVGRNGKTTQSYADHIQNNISSVSGSATVAMSAFNTLVECASNLNPKGTAESTIRKQDPLMSMTHRSIERHQFFLLRE